MEEHKVKAGLWLFCIIYASININVILKGPATLLAGCFNKTYKNALHHASSFRVN